MRKIASILMSILIALLIAGCNRSGSTTEMSLGGESMAPTITNGEKITVDNKAYVSSQPQRGDIIAFKDESDTVMVKRVVGLPGEQVEIKDNKVYVDGTLIKEDYLYQQNSTETNGNSTWKIPDKTVFVMGDNRTHSKDSRDFGPVPYDRIVGKVLRNVDESKNLISRETAPPSTSDDWKTSAPSAQGLNPQVINQFFKDMETNNIKVDSILIVKNGILVTEKYFGDYNQDTFHPIWSNTKSITSTLVGIARDQGKIKLDDKVVDYFPDNKFENMDDAKRTITIKDILTMRSGIQWAHDINENGVAEEMLKTKSWVGFTMNRPMENTPGTVFCYNTGSIEVLTAILNKSTGISEEAYARQYLFDPLGFTGYKWPKDPEGYNIGGSGLALRPRDMAKFGQLMLQNGVWNGQQIVSSDWVKEATTTKVTKTYIPGYEYGYNWWISPELKGYFAAGLYGQFIYILPQQNMVVVFTANDDLNKMLNFTTDFIKKLQS